MTRLLAMLLFVLAFVGCTKPVSSVPRHLASGVVHTVAHAVRVADHVCAEEGKIRWAQGREDEAVSMLTKCAQGYGVARKALIAAAYAVDAWGSAEANGKAVCAVSEGVAGLRLIIASLREGGIVKLPGEVADGMAAAQWIADQIQGGQCEVGK